MKVHKSAAGADPEEPGPPPSPRIIGPCTRPGTWTLIYGILDFLFLFIFINYFPATHQQSPPTTHHPPPTTSPSMLSAATKATNPLPKDQQRTTA